MKTNFTFDELSKVFASIAKIEAAAAKQIEAEKEHEEKSMRFNAEFEKYGYTFRNAPKEVHVMFDEKCASMDEQEKARRKAYKTIKDFAAMLEIGNGPVDWVEEDIKQYLDRKLYFNIGKVAGRCKYLASDAAKRLRY